MHKYVHFNFKSFGSGFCSIQTAAPRKKVGAGAHCFPISPRPSPRPALPCPARRLCCQVPSRPCRPSLHASSHPIPLCPPRLNRAALSTTPHTSRPALFALSRYTPSHLAKPLLAPSCPSSLAPLFPPHPTPHAPPHLPRPAILRPISPCPYSPVPPFPPCLILRPVCLVPP